MRPAQDLIDDIYRERIERARQASFDETLLGGLELFDRACEWRKSWLRSKYPNETETQIHERLLAEIALQKSLEPQAWTTIPSSEASSML